MYSYHSRHGIAGGTKWPTCFSWLLYCLLCLLAVSRWTKSFEETEHNDAAVVIEQCPETSTTTSQVKEENA